MSLSDNPSNLLPDGVHLELLQELENQNLEVIRKLRKHARLETAIPVLLKPANLSSIAPNNHGRTRDISSGGCVAHFKKPVGVGDVYRLSFEGDAVDIPQVYARSLRCIMLRDEVFEVALSFLTAISLEDAVTGDAESELLD